MLETVGEEDFRGFSFVWGHPHFDKYSYEGGIGVVGWLKKQIITYAMPIVFLIGFALLVYPSFSDYWNSFHQSEAIMHYAEAVADMKEEDYKRILDSATDYNKTHPINWNFTEKDREEYNKELNFNNDGAMGYIEIPKINVKLSIFHGTDESVLQTSIGHLEGTSLPVGGIGTHSVLSGHRGLPSARLFSDLDQLREGDIFTIHVLNETLTYEVDQIRVVLPTDLSALTIDPKQDYLTLVTCTPYGINTHRLLVRGHRIENVDGNASIISDAVQIKPIFIAPFIAMPICALLIIYILVVTSSFYQRRLKISAKQYLTESGLPQISKEESINQEIIDLLKENFKN